MKSVFALAALVAGASATQVHLHTDSAQELSGTFKATDGTVMHFTSTKGNVVFHDAQMNEIWNVEKSSPGEDASLVESNMAAKAWQKVAGDDSAYTKNSVAFSQILGETHPGHESPLALQVHFSMIAFDAAKTTVKIKQIPKGVTAEMIKSLDTLEEDDEGAMDDNNVDDSLVEEDDEDDEDDEDEELVEGEAQGRRRRRRRRRRRVFGRRRRRWFRRKYGQCGHVRPTNFWCPRADDGWNSELGVCGGEHHCMRWVCGDCGCHRSCKLHDIGCCNGMLPGPSCMLTSALVMNDCTCC